MRSPGAWLLLCLVAPPLAIAHRNVRHCAPWIVQFGAYIEAYHHRPLLSAVLGISECGNNTSPCWIEKKRSNKATVLHPSDFAVVSLCGPMANESSILSTAAHGDGAQGLDVTRGPFVAWGDVLRRNRLCWAVSGSGRNSSVAGVPVALPAHIYCELHPEMKLSSRPGTLALLVRRIVPDRVLQQPLLSPSSICDNLDDEHGEGAATNVSFRGTVGSAISVTHRELPSARRLHRSRRYPRLNSVFGAARRNSFGLLQHQPQQQQQGATDATEGASDDTPLAALSVSDAYGIPLGLWARGITGAGVSVAVLDTGLPADHPHFRPGAVVERINWTSDRRRPLPRNRYSSDGFGNDFDDNTALAQSDGSAIKRLLQSDVASPISSGDRRSHPRRMQPPPLLRVPHDRYYGASSSVNEAGQARRFDAVSAVSGVIKWLRGLFTGRSGAADSGDSLLSRLGQHSAAEDLSSPQPGGSAMNSPLPPPEIKADTATDTVHAQLDDDTIGHGTFVASIIAGYGTDFASALAAAGEQGDGSGGVWDERPLPHPAGSPHSDCGSGGLAPGVSLHAFRVFTTAQTSFTSWFLDALNYAMAQRVAVINLSIGGPDHTDAPFADKVAEAVGSGATFVSAIGNDGPLGGTLNSPGDLPCVVGVGGLGGHGEGVAAFSSRGPTLWPGEGDSGGAGRAKPDVIAHSVSLSGSTIDGGCRAMSGTSVAAPVVTGAVALLRSGVRVAAAQAVLALAEVGSLEDPRAAFAAPLYDELGADAAESAVSRLSIEAAAAADAAAEFVCNPAAARQALVATARRLGMPVETSRDASLDDRTARDSKPADAARGPADQAGTSDPRLLSQRHLSEAQAWRGLSATEQGAGHIDIVAATDWLREGFLRRADAALLVRRGRDARSSGNGVAAAATAAAAAADGADSDTNDLGNNASHTRGALSMGACMPLSAGLPVEGAVTVWPPAVSFHLRDCPYAWPQCSQPLWAGGRASGAVPGVVNLTLLNSVGVASTVVEGSARWQPGENGHLLRVTVSPQQLLAPWSGWLGVTVEVVASIRDAPGEGGASASSSSSALPTWDDPSQCDTAAGVLELVVATPIDPARLQWLAAAAAAAAAPERAGQPGSDQERASTVLPPLQGCDNAWAVGYADRSSGTSASVVLSTVRVPVSASVARTPPPKALRVLWSSRHSLAYPHVYSPRDELAQAPASAAAAGGGGGGTGSGGGSTSDVLDWRGDSPFTNHRGFYERLRSRGYAIVVGGRDWEAGGAYDLQAFGVLALVDPERALSAAELNAVWAAVEGGGAPSSSSGGSPTSLAVWADWWDAALVRGSRFADDNTRGTWAPLTGGAHVPALNELLGRWGVSLGQQVFTGLVAKGGNERRSNTGGKSDALRRHASGSRRVDAASVPGAVPRPGKRAAVSAAVESHEPLQEPLSSRFASGVPIVTVPAADGAAFVYWASLRDQSTAARAALPSAVSVQPEHGEKDHEQQQQQQAKEAAPATGASASYHMVPVLALVDTAALSASPPSQLYQEAASAGASISSRGLPGRLAVFGDSSCIDDSLQMPPVPTAANGFRGPCWWVADSMLDWLAGGSAPSAEDVFGTVHAPRTWAQAMASGATRNKVDASNNTEASAPGFLGPIWWPNPDAEPPPTLRSTEDAAPARPQLSPTASTVVGTGAGSGSMTPQAPDSLQVCPF